MTEEVSTILLPGQNIKPLVPVDLAKDLIWRLYKLKVCKIKELNGYDDVNYYIEVEHGEDPGQTKAYVFKVANWVDSQKSEFYDACNEMMIYLYNQGFVVNIPVKNVAGQLKSLEKLDNYDGKTTNNVVRLLTFIPGDILYNVPCSNDICFQTGELAAAVDNALQGFNHPFFKTRQTIWMMANALQIKEFLFAVQDEERREMVLRILAEFEENVLGNLQNLPKGMIHGDINEQNLIVRRGQDKVWVHGLLDFGDSQYGCYLFELTLVVIYMMLLGNPETFLEFGGHAIAGYLSKRTISRLEWELLKLCVETRYCQSLVMGAYSHYMDPTNSYVLTTSKNGWDQLKAIRNSPKDKIHDIWIKALKQHNIVVPIF